MSEFERQEQKRIPMGAYVDRNQHRQLQVLARAHERSMSAELRLALKEHLEHETEEMAR